MRRESVPTRTIVSIHAPAWGATGKSIVLSWDELVSIHAPAWGATIWESNPRHSAWFQSTLPRGERRDSANSVIGCFRVSIHAPAWGATGAACGHGCFKHGFNPRSRVGSDNQPCAWCGRNDGFNPRSRVGSDKDLAMKYQVLTVSIHAPAWGATWTPLMVHQTGIVSIHAPAWGATRATRLQ